MWRVRLGLILTALVLVTSLPLAGLAAWLARTSWTQQAALVEAQNIVRIRAVSAAVDIEVERTMGELMTLSTLDPIDSADLARFSAIAARLLPLHPTWKSVLLISPDLGIAVSTDPNSPPTLVNPEWAQSVFATRHGSASTLRQDTTGEWVVNIGVPVNRGGATRYVLAVRVLASSFGKLLQNQQPPEGGVLTLLDSDAVIIARTRNEEKYVGGRPSPDFVERMRSGPSGAWRSVMLEGTPSYSAWHRSAVTGWTVGLGTPSEAIDGPIRRRNRVVLAAAAVTLGLGLVVSIALGRGIVRAQRAAGDAARALARGEHVPPLKSRVSEVAELGAALRDAAAILEQRLEDRDAAAVALSRAKDDFIATVSHELRTPLNAIFGWVAMLRTGSLDAARQARALDVIERNARAQSRVVEDLLDMSSIIRGRMRLDKQPMDLAAAVRGTVDIVVPGLGDRKVPIAVHADTPAWIDGDPIRIRQIVWNLLANAMKFTPDGGSIEVAVVESNHQAVLTVADDGEGITPEFLPHVFDRFRQETDTVTRVHSGLGIGLALARTLTEMHGGTVAAESDGKGAGARFTVRLPLREAAPGTGSPSPPDRPAADQI
jgi:signal transduction histidine kinase